jgi:hypothetical protein
MKTEHTPGPWTHTPSREQGNPDTTRRDIVAESQFGPAFIAGDVSQSEADLIASAPDLLSACEGFLALFKSGKNSEPRNPYTRPEVKAAIVAIAKAKGQS